MTPVKSSPKISISADGTRMHVSEVAYLKPTPQQLLRKQGEKLFAEIVAIDERIGGLQMTPKQFRAQKHADLLSLREEKVKEYVELKKQFLALKSTAISSPLSA